MSNQEIIERFQKAILNAYRQDDEFKNLLKRKGGEEIDINKIDKSRNLAGFVWNVIDWTESQGKATFKKLVKITCNSKPNNQDLQNVGKELFPELFPEVSDNRTSLNGNNNDYLREDSSQEKLKVFLCHDSRDKSFVRQLCNKLKDELIYDLYFDEEMGLVGELLDEEIKATVKGCDACIVFLSKNFSSNNNTYKTKELKWFFDHHNISLFPPEENDSKGSNSLKTRLIPVLINDGSNIDDFPKYFKDRGYARYPYGLTEDENRKEYDKITQALNSLEKQLRQKKN